VILELCVDGTIRIADREDAIRPGDAKKNQIRRIINVANQHFDDLSELWEEAHA
jgi:hypothetical protein